MVKITVNLPEKLVGMVDDYRRIQPTIPSRSKAVATLLKKALSAGRRNPEIVVCGGLEENLRERAAGERLLPKPPRLSKAG